MPFERIQEDGTVLKALYAITFISPKDSLDIELLKKDEFLKYNLLFYNHENFSVFDIIKICANKYGGIHYDETKNLKESLIDITHKHFNLNDSSSVIQSMYSITEICLNALHPLFEKIESN